MRTRICMAIITAIPCGTIVCRESKELTKKKIAAKAKIDAYNKRRDYFMAIGGTRILKTYSDNVAMQIAEFKKSKARVAI